MIKNKLKVILAVVVIFGLVFPLLGEDKTQGVLDKTITFNSPMSLQDKLSQPISIDLRNMGIVDTLKFLAQKGDINIIVSKDVEGRVSLFLKDVSIKEVLEIILLSNNLAFEIRGDILYVMTDKEYKSLHGNLFKDTRSVKIFHLKYAKPDTIMQALGVLKSEIGNVIVDEETGTLILMDTPEKLKMMGEIVDSLDQKMVTRIFDLQYAKAADVVTLLSKRLNDKKTGSISGDTRNNQVIVNALPERMQEVEDILKSLDKKTKAVLIKTKIFKISLYDDFFMGVDWKGIFKDSGGIAKSYVTGVFPVLTSATDPTNYGGIVIGDQKKSISATIKVLEDYGKVKNIASPSVSVMDGEQAKIMIGQTIAYVTTTIETGGTTATTAAQVKFLDVGTKLEVKAIINDEGYITLEIKPEVSYQYGSLDYSIAADVTNKVPLIEKTNAETKVIVKDGSTIVIGGLRKQENTVKIQQVPILGDIPYLGALFRNTKKEVENTEIVVFLTPEIVSGDVDLKDETFKPKEIRGYDNQPDIIVQEAKMKVRQEEIEPIEKVVK